MNKYRTHSCNDLNRNNKGLNVVLSGWINKKRDHGNLLFIDLRDNYGITQCIIDKENSSFVKSRSEGQTHCNCSGENFSDDNFKFALINEQILPAMKTLKNQMSNQVVLE